MHNEELRLARTIIETTGTHLFLTGKAGTGKTTFLRRLREESSKRMVVLAPTGIAAINAGGVTIHSFFQLPFGPFVPGSTFSREQLRLTKRKLRLIRSLDLVVIDEISMVRADLLDAVDTALRMLRRSSQPFGGVQLLMIGDLQQLPPVVKDSERALLQQYYATPYFFGAQALQQTSFVTIELKHVYRQSDEAFISLLNRIREGKADAATLDELNKRYVPGFEPNGQEHYVRLTTHNKQADDINYQNLADLETPSHKFTATVTGTFPELSYPTEYELELKEGAQVMFVKNDPEKRYYNGMIGTVTALSDSEVLVRPADGMEAIAVAPDTWNNAHFVLNEETKVVEEVVDGSFCQYPLKLAWAITIHKSQGLTFDRVMINASAAFAHGQTYVALSRCRTLGGIVLTTPIPPQAIIVDNQVRDFEDQCAASQPNADSLLQMQQAFTLSLLDELFDFVPIGHRLARLLRIFEEFAYRNQGATIDLCRSLLERCEAELKAVALRFRPQYVRLLAENGKPETNSELQERLRKGAFYFSEKLETLIKELGSVAFLSENKELKKRYAAIREELDELLQIKAQLMRFVAQKGFEMSVYQEARTRFTLAADGTEPAAPRKKSAKKEKVKKEPKAKAPKKPKEKKPDTVEVTLNLYNAGLAPQQIADARSLAISTIMGHLGQCVAKGLLPLSELIPSERQRRIADCINRLPDGTKSRFKEIYEALNEEISYEEIRLMITVLENQGKAS